MLVKKIIKHFKDREHYPHIGLPIKTEDEIKKSVTSRIPKLKDCRYRGVWDKNYQLPGYDYADIVLSKNRLFVSLVNDNDSDPRKKYSREWGFWLEFKK